MLYIITALYWLVSGDSSVKKKHECTECGHQFRTKALLKRHNLTHSGERPFTCGTCDKRFSRQDHLRRHMVTHMNAFTPTFPDFQYWVFIIEVCRYCPMSRARITWWECDIFYSYFFFQINAWFLFVIHFNLYYKKQSKLRRKKWTQCRNRKTCLSIGVKTDCTVE